jgi:hypothetical protein
VTTPSKPPLLRCKLATGNCPECHRPIATLLAGNASIRPPFAAMAVGRQRWIARAKWPRAKDLPSRRLLPQDNEGEGAPPQFEPLGHPCSVVESLNEGLDAPVVLTIRPRPSFRHRPAKGNAFPKAGVPSTTRNPVMRRSLFTPRDRGFPLRRRPTLAGTALQPEASAPLLSTPERLTLTRQATGHGSVSRGQVLFLVSHGPTAAPLSSFYNRCCPRAGVPRTSRAHLSPITTPSRNNKITKRSLIFSTGCPHKLSTGNPPSAAFSRVK